MFGNRDNDYLVFIVHLCMALPKKGLRKIRIENEVYGWSVTGNDGWISLSIALIEGDGQLLTASFEYHNIYRADDGTIKTKSQLVVTPGVVRQVIEYALKKGWLPKERKPQMNLGSMDDKVDWKCSDTI